MVQTLSESIEGSSEETIENDEKKTPSLKRRLSLFLTKSSQMNEETKARTEKSPSIGSRLRSFSLLNSSSASDFLNIGSILNTKTKYSTSITNIDNYSSLDENYYIDLKNSKLILNDEKKQLLENE